MNDKVVQTILKYEMISPKSRVIAAVSGGSDSMAMLEILHLLSREMDFTLEVAHVNHCLRGDDAVRDEKYVESVCREKNIPFHLLRADVASLARQHGTSTEEEGRRIRYEFFSSLGDDITVATAHNLNDREETFLFNFARGSALRGLCSIPPKRDNIIRPLIECSKEEIVEFCEKRNIKYVTDNTNADVNYSRNRIRHNVISELKKINPGFDECASRCIQSLNEDEKFLRLLADGLISKAQENGEISAKVIAGAPDPVKKRAIVKIIEDCTGVSPDYSAVERVASILDGGKCEINGGITVRVRRDRIEFPLGMEQTPAPCEFENGTAKCGNITFICDKINKSETEYSENVHSDILEYFIDYDKIIGRLTARCRQEGDKIRLYPSGCTKSLKKLFNEKAVAPEIRGSLPMIADEEGIILIPGMGFDCRVRITKETKEILRIKIK